MFPERSFVFAEFVIQMFIKMVTYVVGLVDVTVVIVSDTF